MIDVTSLDKEDLKTVLKYVIKHDTKLYTDVLVEETNEIKAKLGLITGEFTKRDGYLGYVDGEGRFQA